MDLYNLYGDGSVTPYTRPSSPQQDVSQAEKTAERDETPHTDEIVTPCLPNDSIEGAVGKTAKTKKSCDEGPEDTTKQGKGTLVKFHSCSRPLHIQRTRATKTKRRHEM